MKTVSKLALSFLLSISSMGFSTAMDVYPLSLVDHVSEALQRKANLQSNLHTMDPRKGHVRQTSLYSRGMLMEDLTPRIHPLEAVYKFVEILLARKMQTHLTTDEITAFEMSNELIAPITPQVWAVFNSLAHSRSNPLFSVLGLKVRKASDNFIVENVPLQLDRIYLSIHSNDFPMDWTDCDKPELRFVLEWLINVIKTSSITKQIQAQHPQQHYQDYFADLDYLLRNKLDELFGKWTKGHAKASKKFQERVHAYSRAKALEGITALHAKTQQRIADHETAVAKERAARFMKMGARASGLSEAFAKKAEARKAAAAKTTSPVEEVKHNKLQDARLPVVAVENGFKEFNQGLLRHLELKFGGYVAAMIMLDRLSNGGAFSKRVESEYIIPAKLKTPQEYKRATVEADRFTAYARSNGIAVPSKFPWK